MFKINSNQMWIYSSFGRDDFNKGIGEIQNLISTVELRSGLSNLGKNAE
jgi:hypothetical protein